MEDSRLIVVATISIFSFVLSVYSFFNSQKKAEKEERLVKSKAVLDLHERWWGNELWQLRRDVGKLVNDWDRERQIPKTYYVSQVSLPDGEVLDNKRKIGRIGNFFSDLNVMLDENLLCEKTVYRLFGESQFYWFLPFFQAIESERKSKGTVPHWFDEIKSLDNKLTKYRRDA